MIFSLLTLIFCTVFNSAIVHLPLEISHTIYTVHHYWILGSHQTWMDNQIPYVSAQRFKCRFSLTDIPVKRKSRSTTEQLTKSQISQPKIVLFYLQPSETILKHYNYTSTIFLLRKFTQGLLIIILLILYFVLQFSMLCFVCYLTIFLTLKSLILLSKASILDLQYFFNWFIRGSILCARQIGSS